jgi:hypothetical protein
MADHAAYQPEEFDYLDTLKPKRRAIRLALPLGKGHNHSRNRALLEG